MIRKSSLRVSLSLFLLICFSAIILPIDLFHDHSADEEICAEYDARGICKHKHHLSKTGSSYCSACAFHVEKTFFNSKNNEQFVRTSTPRVFTEPEITAYRSENTQTFLRGPPSSLS